MNEEVIHVLERIEERFNIEVEKCRNDEDVKLLKSNFVGKKSELSGIISGIVNLSQDDKKIVGKECTLLKRRIEDRIRNITFVKGIDIDISLPIQKKSGAIHPLSVTSQCVKSILLSMGASFMESPEIESEWRNFDFLNIGSNHPARQNHQSFFLEHKMLRTHTSSIQSYILDKFKNCDSKTFTIGRVFRNDNDSTHLPMFNQVECLIIEKGANVPCMISFIQTFLNKFFAREMKIRKRPSFFPFTNFSLEIDVWMDGRWLEILGCGIIHPNIFKNAGVEYRQGFAFGCGLERIHMLKYDIHDIRKLYSKDMKVLQYLGKNTYDF
jgi:phenylalanyl-tRNA synthetase alpha chain